MVVIIYEHIGSFINMIDYIRRRFGNLSIKKANPFHIFTQSNSLALAFCDLTGYEVLISTF